MYTNSKCTNVLNYEQVTLALPDEIRYETAIGEQCSPHDAKGPEFALRCDKKSSHWMLHSCRADISLTPQTITSTNKCIRLKDINNPYAFSVFPKNFGFDALYARVLCGNNYDTSLLHGALEFLKDIYPDTDVDTETVVE